MVDGYALDVVSQNDAVEWLLIPIPVLPYWGEYFILLYKCVL